MTSLSAFKRNRRGVTATEYGVLLALVAGLIIVPVTELGGNVKQAVCEVGGSIGGAPCPDANAATTPGAGEVPFSGMAALPAGTVCKTQPDGYAPANGVVGYVRACTAPGGSLYSAAYIAYDSATGLVSSTVFQPSGPGFELVPNGSGVTIDAPAFFTNAETSILSSGSIQPSSTGSLNFNSEVFNNAAYAAYTQNTISGEIQQEQQTVQNGVSTTLGSENAAMDYISGINTPGSPVPTQTGSGNGVFLYSPGGY